MIFDSHIHTLFSTDSRLPIEQAVQAAKEKDFGLIITEHYDYVSDEITDFTFDPGEYFKKYLPLRGDRLLLGIELGLTVESFERNGFISKNYGFDYLLGSTHMVNGLDVIVDTKTNKPPVTTPMEYLKANIEMVKLYPYIDALAHIDYYSRYFKSDRVFIFYEEYKDLYDELFITLKDNNTLLELNSAKLHEDISFGNLMNIFKAYKAAGNEYVTLGSDAHFVEAMGRNFDKAFEIINTAGLKPVYFKNRKMLQFTVSGN